MAAKQSANAGTQSRFTDAAQAFPDACLDDVFGSLKITGPAKSIADMDAALAEEALRRSQD